jgi:hypothetical protein
MSSTRREPTGDGHYVTIQHCEVCDKYLGVNYPSDWCDEHRPKPVSWMRATMIALIGMIFWSTVIGMMGAGLLWLWLTTNK